MRSEKQIIKGCKRGVLSAQLELVERYSGMLMTVCRRYAGDNNMAEDVLQEAFIQIFSNIRKYQRSGSFEAWLRRVTVRCALDWIKLKSNRKFASLIEIQNDTAAAPEHILDRLAHEDLLRLIQALPDGFRSVFNMYSIEGFSHKEIAEMLNISESTSRSQLHRARCILQEKVVLLEKLNARSV